jgi:CIC family chloride channel protein
VASLVLGSRPSFQTTLSTLDCAPADLISFTFLGLIFGILSFIWVRVFYYVEDRFDGLRKVPNFLKVPIGMSVAGILTAIFAWHYTMSTGDSIAPMYYGIMGVGYEGMDLALVGQFSIAMLLLLSISKLVATSFTIGSGGSGGIFAPSLYIGTLFGLGCGYAIHAFVPSTNLLGSPLAYGIGGMAALFAGAARAPLTAMFQVSEMTRSFNLFPAIVIVCVVSYIVSSLLLKGSSIYTIKLERRGRPPIDSAI